jgi:hypothetical protein
MGINRNQLAGVKITPRFIGRDFFQGCFQGGRRILIVFQGKFPFLHHFIYPVTVVLLFGKENKSRRTQYLQLRKLTTQIQKDATMKYKQDEFRTDIMF